MSVQKFEVGVLSFAFHFLRNIIAACLYIFLALRSHFSNARAENQKSVLVVPGAILHKLNLCLAVSRYRTSRGNIVFMSWLHTCHIFMGCNILFWIVLVTYVVILYIVIVHVLTVFLQVVLWTMMNCIRVLTRCLYKWNLYLYLLLTTGSQRAGWGKKKRLVTYIPKFIHSFVFLKVFLWNQQELWNCVSLLRTWTNSMYKLHFQIFTAKISADLFSTRHRICTDVL